MPTWSRTGTGGSKGRDEVWAYSIERNRIVVQFVDIADRLALEEELRELGRRWEVVFEAIGQPAMILSPDQEILSVNRAAERATGLTAEEMVGRRCAEVFHGTADSPECCPFHRLLQSEEAPGGPAELVIEAMGGTYLVSCTPIYDDDGRIEKVVHLATEITDRIRHEQELRHVPRQTRAHLERDQARPPEPADGAPGIPSNDRAGGRPRAARPVPPAR